MEKKILLFDIDSVIFETEKFISWRNGKVQEIIQITPDEARRIFEKVKPICFRERGGYEPHYYAELVASELGREEILPVLVGALEKIVYDDFYYPHTEDVMRALVESGNYVIGIQSEGEEKTQKDKLGHLAVYLDPDYMFFYRTNKLNALEKDITTHPGGIKNNVIVIDDRPEIILNLQKAYIRAVLVKQGKHAAQTSPEELSLINEKVDSIDQLVPLLL